MSTQEVENEQVEEYEEIVKKLVNDILRNPEKYATEGKFILTLETWHRQGSSYIDYNDYRVLAGEVKEIILDVVDEGYPYRIRRKVAIIPLSLPTVLEEERYSETTDPIQSQKFIHVFTSEGWKTMRVY